MAASYVSSFLGDTSALGRASRPSVVARLTPLVRRGLVASCSIVELELGRGARSGTEHRSGFADRALMLELIPIEQPTLDRAVAVQGLLADAGHHRGIPLSDLIIAAAAERAGLTVLHYDADYDRIAAVTGQPVEWVVERGTAD
ncbi:MAG: PIN domain nuclease [Solirubrobacteraceae bacterium]